MNVSLSSMAYPFTVSGVECTTTEMSPFTPGFSSLRLLNNTCHRFSYPASGGDFGSRRLPQHPSIIALIAQLYADKSSQTESSLSMAFAAKCTLGQDQGFQESLDTPVANTCGYLSDFEASDLSMFAISAPSSPWPNLSLEEQALSSYTYRIRQRQTLIRVQRIPRRASDTAMSIEECHHSSSPPNASTWTGSQTKSNSLGITVNGGMKHKPPARLRVRKAPRMRKRGKRRDTSDRRENIVPNSTGAAVDPRH